MGGGARGGTFGHRAGLDSVVELAAPCKLHDEHDLPLIENHFDQVDDVRVLEPPSDVQLPPQQLLLALAGLEREPVDGLHCDLVPCGEVYA